jgi:hypothetical protein
MSYLNTDKMLKDISLIIELRNEGILSDQFFLEMSEDLEEDFQKLKTLKSLMNVIKSSEHSNEVNILIKDLSETIKGRKWH